jgi:D-threonate/D-erythronate kinase
MLPIDIPIQRCSTTPIREGQSLLIADDLTGACDAAAAFLPGNSVRVWLDSADHGDSPDRVQAFNTNSRGLCPTDAAKAVFECARRCSHQAMLFKKIDSAARGSIAVEVLAAKAAWGADMILLAPSFPAQGRIVRGGILHTHYSSGEHDQIQLKQLFPSEFHPDIALPNAPADLSAALAAGKKIAICNAETDEDLRNIARAAALLPGRILYAGSSGLARAIASVNKVGESQPEALLPISSQFFLIVGTQHPVTRLQLEDLKQSQIEANLLVIRCHDDDADTIRSRLSRLNPQAIILTGGDTAQFALTSVGARSIRLRGEIAEGIPWGVIDGGLANERLVVTKSGGFGTSNALRQILGRLLGDGQI